MAIRRQFVTLAGGLLLIASMAAPPVAAHPVSTPPSAPAAANEDGDGVLQVPDALTGANGDEDQHVSTLDKLSDSAVLDPAQVLFGGGPSRSPQSKATQGGKAGTDHPFGPISPASSGAPTTGPAGAAGSTGAAGKAGTTAAGKAGTTGAAGKPVAGKKTIVQPNPDHPTMTPQLAAALEKQIVASVKAAAASLVRAKALSRAPTAGSGTVPQILTFWTVSGHVLDGSAAPVPGTVATIDGSVSQPIQPDGSYTLLLPDGTYQLMVYAADPRFGVSYWAPGGVVYSPDEAGVIQLHGNVTADFTLPRLPQITGSVTNKNGGGPLPGIWVQAIPSPGTYYFGQATTAADGTYTVYVPSGTYRLGFTDNAGTYAGGYYVGAGLPVAGMLSSTPLVIGSGTVSGISPTMGLAVKIDGTVRTTGGTAIPGIYVFAHSVDDTAAVTTDASGGYTFALRPGTYTIEFQDPSGKYAGGYYSTAGLVESADAATPIKLTTTNVTGIDVGLPAYLIVTGRVIAAGTTTGIERVDLMLSGGSHAYWAQSDANGAYQFSLLPDTYILSVVDENNDYRGGYYANGVVVTDRAQATPITISADRSGLDIRLSLLPHISGKVTAAGTMHPVEIEVSGTANRSKLSAADGSYSIGVEPGMYLIHVSDPLATYSGGYYSAAGFTAKRSAATVVTVTTANVTGKSLTLPVGPKLKGTVTDPSGTGIAGVAIVAYGSDEQFEGTSGAGGIFSVPVSIGAYKVQFTPDPSTGFVGGTYSASGLTLDEMDATQVSAAADVSGLNVKLFQGRQIGGKLLTKGGTPAAGVVAASSGLFGAMASAAADGSYTLVVPAGSYRLAAQFDGAEYAAIYYAAAGSTLDLGGASTITVGSSNLTGIDIRMVATHKLGGTLLTASGGAIEGENVLVQPVNGGSYLATVTGPTGAFSFDLLAGEYEVNFLSQTTDNWSYSFGSLDQFGTPVTVGSADVNLGNLHLPQTRVFSGKFTGGAIGEDSYLQLVGTTTSYVANNGSGGTFRANAASGCYVAYVSSSAGSGYYAPGKLLPTAEGATVFTIGTSNVTGVTIALPAAAYVSGKVTTSSGAAIPGVQVISGTYDAYGWTMTGADGSYRLPLLVGATTTLHVDERLGVYTSGYFASGGLVLTSSAATPITMTAAGRTGVDLRLPLNRHISGTIVSAAGKAVSGQFVAAASRAYSGLDQSAFDGTFRLAVPDGSYEISMYDVVPNGALAYRKGSTVTFDEYEATSTAVSGADVGGVNATLPALMKVSGRVTGPGGAGVSDAQVVAFSTVTTAYAYSNVDGSYTLRVPAGKYGLEFYDQTGRYARAYYATTGAVPTQPQASAVAVTTSARTGLNVQLAAGRHVSGTITGGGRALAGYEVDLYSTGVSRYAYSTHVHGDGSYSIEVPAGTYVVMVSQPYQASRLGTYVGGYLTASGGVTFDPEAARRVTVGASDVIGVSAAVPAFPTIRGKVTLPSGAPAASASIWVESDSYAVLATSAFDGTYSVPVPGGTYTAEFMDSAERYFDGYYTPSGITPRSAAATSFAVGASGATGINGKFVTSAKISGRITTSASWATVVARSADGIRQETELVGGAYSIPVPPGTYTLSFEFGHWGQLDRALDGYYAASGLVPVSSAAKSIVVGTSNVQLPTVTDPDGRYLSGHVVGENGLPLGSAEVRYLGSKTGYSTYSQSELTGVYGAPVPADGVIVSFTDMSFGYAGGYLGPNTTTRYTADYASALRQAIATSDVTNIDVTLPIARYIGGTVTSPSGAKVSNIGVEAVLPSGYPALGFSDGTATGSDGKYSLPVGPGTYAVHFIDPTKVYANGWYSTSGFKLARSASSPVTVSDKNVGGIDVKLVGGVGGATFVSLTPNRLVDSRSKIGLTAKLSANHHATFQVTGRVPGDAMRNVPSSAVAVTGNLTVVNQTAKGFLALTPVANDAPTTSTLNFPLGDIRANAITVPLGTGGKLSVTYVAGGGATADVVFDVTGYFVSGTGGATYVAVTPSRLVDSRSNLGVTGKLKAGQHATFHVVDRAAGDRDRNIPSSAIAVTGNLTVVNQTAKGFFSLTPQPADTPTTSTLNFPVGDIRANAVTVPINGDGTLSVTYAAVAGATADVAFDVSGYFEPGTDGAVYVPLTPNRLVDSRIDVGLTAPLTAKVPATFRVTDRVTSSPAKNVPSNAVGVTGNLTVVYPTAKGFLALTTTPQSAPSTSTLNFPVHDIRANAVTAPLGSGGTLSVTYAAASGARADVVFDVTGCFVN